MNWPIAGIFQSLGKSLGRHIVALRDMISSLVQIFKIAVQILNKIFVLLLILLAKIPRHVDRMVLIIPANKIASGHRRRVVLGRHLIEYQIILTKFGFAESVSLLPHYFHPLRFLLPARFYFSV